MDDTRHDKEEKDQGNDNFHQRRGEGCQLPISAENRILRPAERSQQAQAEQEGNDARQHAGFFGGRKPLHLRHVIRVAIHLC